MREKFQLLVLALCVLGTVQGFSNYAGSFKNEIAGENIVKQQRPIFSCRQCGKEMHECICPDDEDLEE